MKEYWSEVVEDEGQENRRVNLAALLLDYIACLVAQNTNLFIWKTNVSFKL
jgi:hypothetical protein